MNNDEILSAGIDIGTSTTQLIFSRLKLANTGGFGSVPKIEVVEKKILYIPAPSIAAASSISRGKPFTNPENMNTARPAPNPKYTTGISHGVLSLSLSAVPESVNITIWKGTIIENTQR